MSDKSLEMFRTLASCGNNSATGRIFNTSHSTVSRTIDNLETYLHTKLVNRDSTPLTLTETGLFLVNLIDDEMCTSQQIRRYICETESPQIRIYFSFPVSWHTVSDRLGKLKRNDPSIRIKPYVADKIRIRALMKERIPDITILPDEVCIRNYRIVESVNDYEWGIVASPGLPLTDKIYIESDNLKKTPFIIPDEQSCIDPIREWIKDDARIEKADTYNCYDVLHGMIKDGYGCAFAPLEAKESLEQMGLVFYTCYPRIFTSIYFYSRWYKDMSDELKDFFEHPDISLI